MRRPVLDLPLLAFALVGLAAVPSIAKAQRAIEAASLSTEPRLHEALVERLRTVDADERVPVYAVLRERRPEAPWFPRVQRLSLRERRATVVQELRAHAERTQRDVLATLAEAERTGRADRITANWLGNFVAARVTRDVAQRIARLDAVAIVRLDAEPDPARLADDTRATKGREPSTEASTSSSPLPPPPRVPGDAVLFTGAFPLWNAGLDGAGILIASVDGGLTAHGDLDGRRWTNVGEIAGNGLDDDHNGYVDDVHGFAFDTGLSTFDDGGGHGTMTAGLLVGDGTCSGIARGQAPGAQLMTCRVLGEVSHWNAIQYALQMGADVQTSSFSYKSDFVPPPDYRMHRDVAFATFAAGLVRCNSSGNDAAFAFDPTSPQRVPLNVAAPACVPSPWRDPAQRDGGLSGVIAVGAFRVVQNQLDPQSARGPFAWSLADVQQNLPGFAATNWDAVHHDDYPFANGTAPGLLKPDVLGPTLTTTCTNGPCRTATFGGTSAATPAVAGVLALWKGANPSLAPEDCAMLLATSTRDVGLVAGKENDYGNGLVDAERGLLRALCVHRVDHSPAFAQRHDVTAGPVHLAIDGAPLSLAAIVVGPARQPLPLPFLELGVGPTFEVAFVGATDAEGDLSVQAATGPWLRGVACATQGVLWDPVTTGRLLAGNAIAIEFY